MPVLDGLGASRQIAELARVNGRKPTPVVALTASCSDEEKQRCTEAGMAGHLAKPIKIELLQALLLKCSSGSSRSKLGVSEPHRDASR